MNIYFLKVTIIQLVIVLKIFQNNQFDISLGKYQINISLKYCSKYILLF